MRDCLKGLNILIQCTAEVDLVTMFLDNDCIYSRLLTSDKD